MLRQWTCLSDYRLRLLTGFTEREATNDFLNRALAYYERVLQAEDVKRFSWLTPSEQML